MNNKTKFFFTKKANNNIEDRDAKAEGKEEKNCFEMK